MASTESNSPVIFSATRCAAGLDDAGRHHRIGRTQSVLDDLRIQPDRRKLRRRGLHEDLLVLHADVLHLAHIGHAQQFIARLVDELAHLGIREPVAGERVKVPERIAELVVEHRALHAFGEFVMLYHIVREEADAAADWFERMIELRDHFAIIYAQLPITKSLRARLRWARLAQLMNLPGSSGGFEDLTCARRRHACR